MPLHHCKVQANTDAWACAKGQVRVTRKLFFSLGAETRGIKLLRFWEIVLSAMQQIRDHQHAPPLRNTVAVDLNIAYSPSGEDMGRGIQPQRLLEHLEAIRQMGQVVIGWRAPLQDRIHFFLPLLIGLWMLTEQIPRPGQSGGG